MRAILRGFVIGFINLFLITLGHTAQIDLQIGSRVVFPPGELDRPIIVVNQGDTVRWTYVESFGTNFTRSYGGEWRSQIFTNAGDNFSYTFTNSGLFAYHTVAAAATITVLPLEASNPPALTINDPWDGLRLPGGATSPRALASLGAGESNVASVSFVIGTNIVATVTNAPYTAWVQGPNPGVQTLRAMLLRRDGSSAWSRPVHYSVGNGLELYFLHVLPRGQLLMYFSAGAPGNPGSYLMTKLSLRDPRWINIAQLDTLVGVFVDGGPAGVTNASPQAFYEIEVSEIPPETAEAISQGAILSPFGAGSGPF